MTRGFSILAEFLETACFLIFLRKKIVLIFVILLTDDGKEHRLDKSPVDGNQDRQLDLRAELQRRRNYRVDVSSADFI